MYEEFTEELFNWGSDWDGEKICVGCGATHSVILKKSSKLRKDRYLHILSCIKCKVETSFKSTKKGIAID